MRPGALSSLRDLDRLAAQASPLHRLDARVKVLVCAAYCAAVISVPKYDLAALAPFLLFPLLGAGLAGLDPLWLLRRALPAAWVALILGAFNPLLDRQALHVGGAAVGAGWVSLAVLLAKSLLSAGMALLMVASTSFAGFCEALTRLGAPKAFATQLLFLWRYIGVLSEEAERLTRARDLRDPLRRARGLRFAARLIGKLLQRTLDRADRIHAAMLSRGYQGPLPRVQSRAMPAADALWLLLLLTLLLAFRWLPLSALLGAAVLGRGA